ncbi:hypothetical protein D9M70_471340 [compost metagenome]
MEDAISAETHPVDLFIGLEVQVRRAALDRIQQHLVDEAHHRGVVSFLAGHYILLVVVDRLNIQAVQVDVGEVFHPAVGAFEELLDGFAQLVVLHQDGFGGQPGAELDVGHRLVVAGVGQGDEQLVAAPPQW